MKESTKHQTFLIPCVPMLDEDSRTLFDYIKFVWGKRGFIALSYVLVLVGAAIFYSAADPRYRTKVTFEEDKFLGAGTFLIERLVKSREFLVRVGRHPEIGPLLFAESGNGGRVVPEHLGQAGADNDAASGGPTDFNVIQRVESFVRFVPMGRAMVISVEHKNPEAAFTIATKVTEELAAEMTRRRMQKLEVVIKSYREQLAHAATDLAKAAIYQNISQNQVTYDVLKQDPLSILDIIDPPYVPQSKVFPSAVLILLLFPLLIIAVLLIPLWAMFLRQSPVTTTS